VGELLSPARDLLFLPKNQPKGEIIMRMNKITKTIITVTTVVSSLCFGLATASTTSEVTAKFKKTCPANGSACTMTLVSMTEEKVVPVVVEKTTTQVTVTESEDNPYLSQF
jgi:hypothetical protein